MTPAVESVEARAGISGVGEVVAVNYDLCTLRITLLFEAHALPVYVEFDGVAGFRVLDEGDLNEFWSPEVRAVGWLWKVHGGGWYDLERTRPGFLSGNRALSEYLVLGQNECVSVLSYEPPNVRVPRND